MPDPWVGLSKIPTNLPVPQPTFTQRQLEEATAAARHEAQKETLKVVADMFGSLGIMTSTGQTLTNEVIRQRVEMYPGIPTPDTQANEPKHLEPEPSVIQDIQDRAIPDTQNTRDVPDIRNTREIPEAHTRCSPQQETKVFLPGDIGASGSVISREGSKGGRSGNICQD